jgi:hypothetical protein
MNENGKIRLAEIVPGMEGTLVNITMYPQYNNNKIR